MERSTSQLGEYAPGTTARRRVAVFSANKEMPVTRTRVVNSRGVPGTISALAHTLHDGRAVLLSTWHVFYGNGARDGEGVWLISGPGEAERFTHAGQTLYGKIGTVRFRGEEFYVDCAVASCEGLVTADASILTPFIAGYRRARVGELVMKTGAATGTTRGIIVDANYSAANGTGAHVTAPNQLLIRPVNRQAPFSAEGDSGALIQDETNCAVGLLWGANTRGEGVACAIEPVLYVLNIALATVTTHAKCKLNL